MSEPLAERLSQFTPEASGLNRDALLFAAGRASARPGRLWPILAAVLAVSQISTLVCLWPRTPAPAALVAPLQSEPAPATLDPLDLPLPASTDEETTPAGLLSGGFERPLPPADKELVPPDPPLHAFGTATNRIVN